jgi:hypothetical protein
MPLWLAATCMILVLVVALAAILYGLTRPAEAPPPNIDWKAANHPELRVLLRQGDRLGALELYRSLSGSDKVTARAALDHLLAHPDAYGD